MLGRVRDLKESVVSGGVWMGAVTCRSWRRHKANATDPGELSRQICLFGLRAVPDGRPSWERLRLVALLGLGVMAKGEHSGSSDTGQ